MFPEPKRLLKFQQSITDDLGMHMNFFYFLCLGSELVP